MSSLATGTLTALLALVAVAVPLPASAAPAPTFLYASDPEGDAIVEDGEKNDLAEGVYEGADMNRVDVDNDDNPNGDVLFTFWLENIQGDATVGQTRLEVDNTVKYLVKKANKKKGTKAVYDTRVIEVAYTIASEDGEDEVSINGDSCFGTAASITNETFSHFTITVPIACFGSKPIAAAAAFSTRGTDYATGATVRDSVRTGVYSLRDQS